MVKIITQTMIDFMNPCKIYEVLPSFELINMTIRHVGTEFKGFNKKYDSLLRSLADRLGSATTKGNCKGCLVWSGDALTSLEAYHPNHTKKSKNNGPPDAQRVRGEHSAPVWDTTEILYGLTNDADILELMFLHLSFISAITNKQWLKVHNILNSEFTTKALKGRNHPRIYKRYDSIDDKLYFMGGLSNMAIGDPLPVLWDPGMRESAFSKNLKDMIFDYIDNQKFEWYKKYYIGTYK